MRTIVNYKNNDKDFWKGAIRLSIFFSIIPIACFIGEVVLMKNIIIDSKLDQIPYFILLIPVQFFVFKYLQPFGY